MMTEERVGEEIAKLEQGRMNLFGQLKQVEGALATLQAVLNPPAEVEVEGEVISLLNEDPTLTVVEEEEE